MAAGDTDQSLQLRVAERFTYCVNFCSLRCLYQLLFTLNALNVRLVGYITMYVYCLPSVLPMEQSRLVYFDLCTNKITYNVIIMIN